MSCCNMKYYNLGTNARRNMEPFWHGRALYKGEALMQWEAGWTEEDIYLTKGGENDQAL